MISILGDTREICDALLELKTLQDFLKNSKTKYFGKLLFQLVGVDTIPVLLFTKDGLLKQLGTEIDSKTGKKSTFTSTYFRIESIDKEKCCATFSLLFPMDIQGDEAKAPSDLVKLIKTTNCANVDLSCVNAIQTVDLELLKRKIIVEPKW